MVFVSSAFEWLLTDPRNEQVDDPLIDLDVLRDAGRRWAADLPGVMPRRSVVASKYFDTPHRVF
jgi:hypothetical protein